MRKFRINRLIRSLLSYSTLLGIIEKPSNKKDGISIFIRLKDEEDWIEHSILSIKDFADEIIVGDNGSLDRSVKIVESLIKAGLNIQLYKCPDMRISDLTNYLFKKTSYRWVMKWDADFVARTSGKYSITNLRTKLLNMDRNRYYLVMLSHICLAGDLFHQNPRELIHTEEYIYSNSDRLIFIHPGTCESLKSPKYYAVVRFQGYYSFHVDVKSSDRMLTRKYWFDWMKLKDYQKFPTPENFARYRVMQDSPHKSFNEEKNHYVNQYCMNLIPFNSDKFGNYPDILKDSLLNPKYRIVYREGKIIGRNDTLS